MLLATQTPSPAGCRKWSQTLGGAGLDWALQKWIENLLILFCCERHSEEGQTPRRGVGVGWG